MKYNYKIIRYISFLIIAIYILQKIYKNTNIILPVKETFIHHKQVICNNDECDKTCKKPEIINNKCSNILYKKNNKCFRKCPYICSNPLDACKLDACCASCGLVDIETPCIEDENYIPSEYNKNFTKNDNDTKNIFNNNYYDYWIPYEPKWSCQYNVTGTFTECGPMPINTPVKL